MRDRPIHGLLTAALLLMSAVRLGAQSGATITSFMPMTADSFRVHLRVICRNQPLYGLTKTEFAVRENETYLSTSAFQLVRAATPTSDCVDASLVINSSNAMQNGTPSLISQTKNAVKRYLDGMRPGCDRSSLVMFDSAVTLGAFLTDDKAKLKKEIDAIQTAGGRIALWDATYLAMQELYINGIQTTRSIILLTAGNDNSSGYSLQEIIDFARSNTISIYAVGLGFGIDSVALRKAAIRTGGRYFASASGADLDAVLSDIRQLQQEEHLLYQLEYRSPVVNIRKRLLDITVSDCDQPLTTKYYYDSGVGGQLPAPFMLGAATIRNTDLFRVDHTGCNTPVDYALDTLRLRWQASAYNDPFLNESVTYSWNAILDSAGKKITVSLPSDGGGTLPTLTLDGLALYRALIARGTTVGPDSVLVRIPWFVKAETVERYASFSDTAGTSSRAYTAQSPPTPALIFSVNRKPDPPPLSSPQDGAVVRDLSATSSVALSWQSAADINVQRGKRAGGFRNWNGTTRQWELVPSRTTDSMTYQIRCDVLRTSPVGRGAPIGTSYRFPLGVDVLSSSIPPATLNNMFGGFADTLRRADTVVIGWKVDVHDFNVTNGMEVVLFDSLWSGIGCRPHISNSLGRTMTLIRYKSGPVIVHELQPRSVRLGQNHPNPFRESTVIAFDMPRTSREQMMTDRDLSGISTGFDHFTFRVLDILGRVVLDLTRDAREHREIVIHRSQLPGPGIYYYTLSTTDGTSTKKMLLLR